MKTTKQLKMDLLAAKYFNRRHFPLRTKIKWWIKGFIAFRELQKRNRHKR